MPENPEPVPNELQIGDWRFYVGAHELQRDGETVRLEPRVAALLLYLARRPGQPVSRAALFAALWPGVVVSDEALTNAVNKLRQAFGDDRSNPRVIETIPKSGYRLIAPVKTLGQESAASPPADRVAPAGGRFRPRWQITLFALILAGLAVILVHSAWFAGPPPEGSERAARSVATGSIRPTIAVLPFDNLSANADEVYFAEGVTDDLITRLAKHPGLTVIARDSTFFYRGRLPDPQVVANELRVGYLLRGSIRREAEVLKLNAWLIDAGSGEHVWAEHYERDVGRVFEIENAIYSAVTTALGAAPAVVADASVNTSDPAAYDKLLLGRHHFYKFQNPGENLKARAYFEEAVRLDPGYAAACAMLAWTYAFEAMNGWTDDRAGALQQAERIATRAIRIQPDLPLAYYVRGLAYREQHEYVKALVEAQKTIEYDPNNANGHVLLATLLYYAGRPEEGLARIRKAMQINPHHPYNYHFHLGQAYFVLHRYREAIAAFRQGLASNPASERMRVWLAAALAKSGDIEAARWEGEQVMAADSGFSLQRMTEAFPFRNPADTAHFVEGLQLAGLR